MLWMHAPQKNWCSGIEYEDISESTHIILYINLNSQIIY